MYMNQEFLTCGSEYITEKIQEAVQNGSRNAKISGNWIIDEVVRIPSNFTLILELVPGKGFCCGQYAVALAGAVQNLMMYGIECAEGTKMFLDNREKSN